MQASSFPDWRGMNCTEDPVHLPEYVFWLNPWVNIMFADDQVMQEARASTDIFWLNFSVTFHTLNGKITKVSTGKIET